jgi:hypothetical protein
MTPNVDAGPPRVTDAADQLRGVEDLVPPTNQFIGAPWRDQDVTAWTSRMRELVIRVVCAGPPTAAETLREWGGMCSESTDLFEFYGKFVVHVRNLLNFARRLDSDTHAGEKLAIAIDISKGGLYKNLAHLGITLAQLSEASRLNDVPAAIRQLSLLSERVTRGFDRMVELELLVETRLQQRAAVPA